MLWQGRPSWRSNLSHFVVWVPIALLPAIIAGALTAKDQDTGLSYRTWISISIILVILVVGSTRSGATRPTTWSPTSGCA